MLTNKNQTRVSISGLTYNNLIEDAYNALKDSDEFKNNFTSFTSNSAERMIVELYAYVASQLANRMDQMGNELFVDTASISGLSRLMKLVGAKLDFPAAAEVEVEVSTSSITDKLKLSKGINDVTSTELKYIPGAFKHIQANNGTSWEFIKKEIGENGEFVYDYTHEFDFEIPSQKYILQQGRTQAKSDYVINSVGEPLIIRLDSTSVIKNSVRIYYKDKVLKEGTTDTYEIKELKKVDNFFTTDALTARTGVYTVNNLGNGRAEICIKPYENTAENVSDIGRGILIMYRTGGGENGNIAPGNIDLNESFTIVSNGVETGRGLLHITNTKSGLGGINELTTNEIRNTVIQEVRNTKIAITEEDYEYLLPKYDKSIELIKCYGEKNEETADLAETYGYYVNPLNVWLIILKYNQGFSSAYENDVSGLTDRINDIAFSTLDINPRFNEKYQINSAYLNQVFRAADLKDYFNQESHKYAFPIDVKGIELLKSKGCQITVTNYPYIESAESSRRGVNCFKRYNTTATPITWKALTELEAAVKGFAYLVTDMDKTKGVNNRWKCTETFNSQLTPEEFDEHWEKVDFSYIYDNLVAETEDPREMDRMWVQQSTDDASVFSPVYSNLSYSFAGDTEVFIEDGWHWDSTTDPGKIKVLENERLIITINGQNIIIPGGTSYTLQELCDVINDRLEPTTNIVFLKENIPDGVNGQIVSSEDYVRGLAHMYLTVNGESVNVELDPTNVTTYGDLVDKINESFANANVSNKFLAVMLEANDCINIGIISKYSFTYKDYETDGNSALYTHMLNNIEPTWPIHSATIELDPIQAEEWSDYLSSTGEIAHVGEDGVLYLEFDEESKSISVTITGEGDIVNLFKRFFGIPISTTGEVTKNQSRIIDLSYSETASSLLITTTSPDDLLAEDIYINIFGPKKNEIRLGEYYENIEEYLPDVPDVVLNLLKRRPIKHLYSTAYITTDYGDVMDKYGSSYKLKFSTGLIEEQTFNQLSKDNSPAEITTRNEVGTSFTNYNPGSKLLVKVDSVEYDGTGSFTVVVNEQEITITVPATNGYAEFDLSWFNGVSILTFAKSLVSVFKEQGNNLTPLLMYTPTVDNTIKIYTTSSSFYSSIDFGNTAPTILYSLFGLEDSTVYSREGQIVADEIDYKVLSMTNSLAVGNSIHIEVEPTSNGEIIASDVLIGYNLQNFTNNLSASEVGEYVAINNLRLVLLLLNNGAKIRVTVSWNDDVEYNIWKGMFTPDTWKNFIPSNDGKSATCELINEGDYYIRYDEEDGGYYFMVENPDAFPLGDIYFHMYEDYSNDHIVESTPNYITYTDEYIWNNIMTKKRVMLTEHVYKQPRFIPFDLSIICYLPNVETFSSTDYNQEIAKYLRTEYGLYSDNIGEEILPSDIILNIKEKFPKIKSVFVDYIGYELTNPTTNKGEDGLKTEFNQKHILASTEESEEITLDESTSTLRSMIVTKHGLKLTLKYVS